jgi:hypothetical protein
MCFGKYKGQRAIDVIVKDPQYMKWVVNNVTWFNADDKLKAAIVSNLKSHYWAYKDKVGWDEFIAL